MAKTVRRATGSADEEYPDALILKEPPPEAWRLGSGKATARFGGGDINPSGDWTPYKVGDEHQAIKFEFDTQGCAVFGTLKAWAMLARFHGFDDFPLDMSERYSGAHAGTDANGTDPYDVAEITRARAGAVPQATMPWTPDIKTLAEYYDRRMANGNLPLGKKLLDRFELGYEWLFPWGNTLTPEEKHALIREGLKRGPVCVSVKAWRRKGTRYTKKRGEKDTHWTTALRYEGPHLRIHDTYEPFEKELDELYDCNVAMVFFLKRKTEVRRSFWSIIWDNFARLNRRGV